VKKTAGAATAATPMHTVEPMLVYKLKCRGSIPTAAKPVSMPPLAPLIAAASIPRIQMCILFISVYGLARRKRLRFFCSHVAFTDAARTPNNKDQ